MSKADLSFLDTIHDLQDRVQYLEAHGSPYALHPCVRVHIQNDVTLTDSVENVIDWTDEDYDTADMHEGVTHPERLVAPRAGKYMVLVTGNFYSNATGGRYLTVWNQDDVKQVVVGVAQDARLDATYLQGFTIVELAAGDYVYITAWQDSGGDLALTGGGYSWAAMFYLAA